MRLLEVSMALGIVLTIAVSCLLDFKSTYDDLRENVLRMHILANSDSDEDQALKLKVRDALLEHSSEIFADCDDVTQAEAQALQSLETIQEIAQNVVTENGYDYPVSAELTNMWFDDRTYGDLVMPNGYYDAIRITIGSAEGHNWWCVMYPAMCISAVSEDSQATPEDYFDGDTLDVLQNHDRYVLKLKCVEWLERYL